MEWITPLVGRVVVAHAVLTDGHPAQPDRPRAGSGHTEHARKSRRTGSEDYRFVRALAVLEYGESPAALFARTR